MSCDLLSPLPWSNCPYDQYFSRCPGFWIWTHWLSGKRYGPWFRLEVFEKAERSDSEECNYTEFTLQFHWTLFYTWILLFYSWILQNLISEREGKVFLIQIHDLSFRHFFRNRRDKNALAWSPRRKYLADRNFWSTRSPHFNRSCFKSQDFFKL